NSGGSLLVRRWICRSRSADSLPPSSVIERHERLCGRQGRFRSPSRAMASSRTRRLSLSVPVPPILSAAANQLRVYTLLVPSMERRASPARRRARSFSESARGQFREDHWFQPRTGESACPSSKSVLRDRPHLPDVQGLKRCWIGNIHEQRCAWNRVYPGGNHDFLICEHLQHRAVEKHAQRDSFIGCK